MDYLTIQELYHHGIKDQKWGIRRFQNPDGSLTAEGRKRYNKGTSKDDEDTKDWEKKNLHKRDGKYYYTDKDGKEHLYKTNASQLDDKDLKDLKSRVDTENSIRKFEADVKTRETKEAVEKATRPYKNTQNVLNDSAKVLDATVKALPTGGGHYEKKDYSDISDQELRNRISRLQLEESYGRLSGDTKYVKSGSEKAREILQTVGAVVAIGAATAGLASTIADIKERKKQSASHSDLDDDNYLEHHGVKGQKWGIRRYQNEDGSLTTEGQIRYGGKTHIDQLSDKEKEDLRSQDDIAREEKDKKRKTALIIGAVAAGTAAVIGAAWLASKYSKQKTEINIHNQQQQQQIAKNALRNERRHATNMAKIAVGINPNARTNTYINNTGQMAIKNLGNIVGVAAHVKHNEWSDKLDYLDIQELYHHGIKGQRWGVRRWQEESGTLTPEGRERYRTSVASKEQQKKTVDYDKLTSKQAKEYADYSKQKHARRGALIGAGVGAIYGVGKKATRDIMISRNPDKYKTKLFKADLGKNDRDFYYSNGGSIVASYLHSAAWNAVKGAVVGSIIGRWNGKRLAKQELAAKGMEYTDKVLKQPIINIEKEQIKRR